MKNVHICWISVKYFDFRLSSAGLVYAHFGLEVINEMLNACNIGATSECLRYMYLHIYDGFVEELDAIDNGVPMYSEGMKKIIIFEIVLCECV